MHITFVRHMETGWNAERLFTAQAFHIRLNAAGIAEADRMADRLAHACFQKVFSSDQIRAVETTLIIAAKHPLITGFATDPRLREVHVGSLVGTKMANVTEPLFQTRHPQFDYRPIGGEHRAGVVARQREFLADVKRSCSCENILVVGHGTALRVLLEDMGINETLTRENYVCVEI